MTDICSQVPSTYSKEQLYGYHRQCYQRFTGNLHRLQVSSDYYLLRKIKGYDLFACEAQYHRSCHKEYIHKSTNLSMDFNLKLQQSDMEAAHKDALTEVCAIVDNKLIKEGGIVKLSDLREIYVARLEKTPFANHTFLNLTLAIFATKNILGETVFLSR